MYEFADQKKVVYVVFAIILLISALIAPVGIFLPIKAMFITPEAIEIGTSSLSLVTGGIGLALLAGVLIALATMENRLKKYGTALALFVFSIIGLTFSLADYYYITSEKFVYNDSFTLAPETYNWTDFEKVEERVTKDNGVTKVNTISFYSVCQFKLDRSTPFR
ncbi:hypothetical protein [Metaplanococcus flavidus]|uniref:Uncharacterized protein n=1 Tax=Metaplanococcus flavidus TaxID=569883 RepID=A0ABW3LE42_9BACL